MLYECAAHGTRVASVDVEYIGWKSYGMFLHSVDGLGANFTWPKPFAALAVMNPDWPEVMSLTTARSPCAVSCSVTVYLSPDARNRSFDGSGRPDAIGSKWTGFGGPCGLPLWVRYAKLTGSTPTRFAHVSLSCFPVTGLIDRLSIVMATHHLVAEQLKPSNWRTYPGG